MAMAQRLVLAALLLPLATGHLNVLISQAEVKKLLGEFCFDFEHSSFFMILNDRTDKTCAWREVTRLSITVGSAINSKDLSDTAKALSP